ISLSTWIRDYIYIPLGGSRRGAARKVANGLTAFAICGLWHGAGWNFIFWGLYHGVGLALHSQYRWLLDRAGPAASTLQLGTRPAAWVGTLLFVSIGWLFFFYPVGQAFGMVRSLVTLK